MTTRTLKTVALALAVCLCGISQLAAKDISQMLEDNMDGGGYDGLLDRYPDGTSQNTMDDLETLKTSILSRLNEGTPLYKELESQANAPDEPARTGDQDQKQVEIYNSGNLQMDNPDAVDRPDTQGRPSYSQNRSGYPWWSRLVRNISKRNQGQFSASKRNPFCPARRCGRKRTIANFNGLYVPRKGVPISHHEWSRGMGDKTSFTPGKPKPKKKQDVKARHNLCGGYGNCGRRATD